MTALTNSQQRRLFLIKILVKRKILKVVENIQKMGYDTVDSVIAGTIEKLERNERGLK